MKKILLALFLIAAAVIVSGAEIIGQVVGVSDGDTITILDNLDKGRFRVRLYGIDAPEKRQAFGNKAKGYLPGLIFGKQVTVRYSSIDRYGRIVGRIYLDKKDIALAMLSAGYAWHYVHFDKSPEYAAAEKKRVPVVSVFGRILPPFRRGILDNPAKENKNLCLP